MNDETTGLRNNEQNMKAKTYQDPPTGQASASCHCQLSSGMMVSSERTID